MAWLGVLQQAKRFNPNYLVNGKPVQFASFAVWGIRGAVQKMMNFGSKSKTPQNGAKLVSGNAFIANQKGEANEFFETIVDPKQLDNPLEETDRVETLQKYVQDALATLSARDRAIIEQQFGIGGDDPKSRRKIAAGFGVSHQRIHQINRRAMEMLRKRLPPAVLPLLDVG